MPIEIKKAQTPIEVGLAVAQIVADRICAFKPTPQKPYFVLGLPTGSTPFETYNALIKMNEKGDISFDNVVTFNMDEYVELNGNHPQSYRYFMDTHFFNHIKIDKARTHVLNGLAENPVFECAAYEDLINSFGGIDLQLGGIGENGHIAFNEPGTPKDSRTHLQELTRETIEVNARFFEHVKDVPTHALTMGLGTLLKAKEIIIIATGAKKANAVYLSATGPVTEQVPASLLQTHPRAIFFCDNDAARDLPADKS